MLIEEFIENAISKENLFIVFVLLHFVLLIPNSPFLSSLLSRKTLSNHHHFEHKSKMSKRRAGTELTHDNWDQEDEQQEEVSDK